MKPVFVVGGGGLGRELRSYLLESETRFVGFLDDVPGPNVVGDIGPVGATEGEVIVAVGSVPARLEILRRLSGSAFHTFIHPTAVVSPDAQIGIGSMVGPFCVIGPGVSVGEHSVINIRCTLGHDVKVGSCCVVSPHVVMAGGSQLGDRTFVGSSVVVFQNVVVESDCILSAIAAVNRSVVPWSFVAGNPARAMPRGVDNG